MKKALAIAALSATIMACSTAPNTNRSNNNSGSCHYQGSHMNCENVRVRDLRFEAPTIGPRHDRVTTEAKTLDGETVRVSFGYSYIRSERGVAQADLKKSLSENLSVAIESSSAEDMRNSGINIIKTAVKATESKHTFSGFNFVEFQNLTDVEIDRILGSN